MACCGPMPKSTILAMSEVTQLVMRLPPEAPTASSTPSLSITRAGVMLLRGNLPGAMEFTRSGSGSNHIMPLFMMTPDPLGMMPEPKADMTVLVSETALPLPSMTTRWVVPLSRAGLLAASRVAGCLPSWTQGSPGWKVAGATSVMVSRR